MQRTASLYTASNFLVYTIFMENTLPFQAGRPLARAEPLGRYLPPIPGGIIAHWLGERLPPGAWVLDPFGASPRLAIEAARAGYRVLVAANNPIARFLTEMAANPPTRAEFQAALSELAAAYKGDERIEPHLRALYETECAACGQKVMAEAFIWERGAESPQAALYQCPHCGDSGEHPVTPADARRAAQFTSGGLHRARALERVAPPHDPDRAHAEEAIEAYLPRAVYALFTLINKLDGLSLTEVRRRCLHALLLSACERGNTLWAYPTERERPRSLLTPPRFRENNLWLALEQAVERWEAAPEGIPVPLAVWPNQPPETGGICLFEGRLKDLAACLPDLPIQAVASALPRPNQAYWTLSALWAGWLWGREAVGPFKSVLRRRRYDWGWHTSALHAALGHLAPMLGEGTPFLGLIGENEPGFLTAALAAADAAGFDLQGLALRPETGQAQIAWQRAAPGPLPLPGLNAEQVARQAALDYLAQRAEPAAYLPMLAAALSGMAQAHLLRAAGSLPPEVDETTPAAAAAPDLHTLAQNAARQALAYRSGYARYGVSEPPPAEPAAAEAGEPLAEKSRPHSESLETGLWFLRPPAPPEAPLSDRLERALVSRLVKRNGLTLAQIDAELCQDSPGLLTPSLEVISAMLESYAEADEAGTWRLRPQDQPARRRLDLDEAQGLLASVGQRLGFRLPLPAAPAEASGRQPVIWADAAERPQYWFFPIASAVIGEVLLQSETPPARSLIVLPGGRANLVLFKLRHDPRLAHLCQAGGWRFLKFRHLRWLGESPLLSQQNLDESLNLDPLTYATPQLRLL